MCEAKPVTPVRRSVPLQLLLSALMLLGFALSQSRCDDAATYALAAGQTSTAAGSHHAGISIADDLSVPGGDSSHGLGALCLSVLAALAAGLILVYGPRAFYRQLAQLAVPVRRLFTLGTRSLTLAQLCVLRA